MNTRKPMIGEVVLFTPTPDDTIAKSNHNGDPIPAIVTRVWSEVCVNLKIIPDCGPMQDRTSVTHQSANPAGYHFKFQDEHYNPELKLTHLRNEWQYVTEDSPRFHEWLKQNGIVFDHDQRERQTGIALEINLFNLGVNWGAERHLPLETDKYSFGALGKFAEGGVMRRISADSMTPVEQILTQSQLAVEKMGAHELLTDAIVSITNARHNVSDFLEGIGK